MTTKNLRNNLAVFGSIGLASLLLVSYVSATQSQSQAATLETITGAPVGTDGLIRVKSLDVKESVSKNSDISIAAENDGDRVSFRAVSDDHNSAELGIDYWKVSLKGAVLQISPEPIAADKNQAIEGSIDLLDFALADYFEQIEEYPGIYTLTLLGFNSEHRTARHQELEEQKSDYGQDELAVYKLEASVVIGYDQDQIRQRGYIIKLTNAAIAGEKERPLELSPGEGKNIEILVVNNEDHPVSGLINYASTTFMNAELTKAIGSTSISEYTQDTCIVLKPGESMVYRTMSLGPDSPPIGGAESSLADKMGDGKSARSGLYVVEIEGGTKACSLEDEEYPSMTFESMFAVEVI